MRKTLTVFSLTIALLILLDVVVAITLSFLDRTGRVGSLVQYFEYGRSVPGKLAKWEAEPNRRDNLYTFAWRPDIVARSAELFAAEPEGAEPVIRTYGMSFVNDILSETLAQRPDLTWDRHSGPQSPPNFTYALFEEDRANRRAGDIVVLGVLSSSLHGMAAHSNSTTAFEQPAPFTYPIYIPDDANGIQRVEPLVTSVEEQRALASDPELASEWRAHLKQYDAFYGPENFGLPILDKSPFARLARRSIAISAIEKDRARVLDEDPYPIYEVLKRMIRDFARTAREDGQTPVVMLVQSRDQRDADLLAITRDTLEADNIPYFATAEHYDPRNPAGFLADGHYADSVNRTFATAFIDLLGL